MNVKQGDIAWTMRTDAWRKLVTVRYLAPAGMQHMPDGIPAFNGNSSPVWVVESLGGPIPAPYFNPATRQTGYQPQRFLLMADSYLRPLRGDDEQQDVSASRERDKYVGICVDECLVNEI